MASKAPETPRSVFAQVILDRLDQEAGGPLAGLRDHHVKWLLAFTKYLFSCATSSITIAAGKKKLYLHPADADGNPLSEDDFAKVDTKTHAKKLPEYLRIPAYSVTFKRLKPKTAKALE